MRANHAGRGTAASRTLSDPRRDGATDIRCARRSRCCRRAVRAANHVASPNAGQRAQSGLHGGQPPRSQDRNRRRRPAPRPPRATIVRLSTQRRRGEMPRWCVSAATPRSKWSVGYPTSKDGDRGLCRRVRRSNGRSKRRVPQRPPQVPSRTASACTRCGHRAPSVPPPRRASASAAVWTTRPETSSALRAGGH